MLVCAVHFKRAEKLPWEDGIGISKENEPAILDVIVDKYGKPLASAPWDFKPVLHRGCIIFFQDGR